MEKETKQIILDKNNNIIEKGDVIRVFDKGFKTLSKKNYEYLEKLGKRFENIKLIKHTQYEYSETEDIYYQIDENGNRVEWVTDYEKEVIEIDNKLCLGFEGDVIFLNMGLKDQKNIFEIIKKGNKK